MPQPAKFTNKLMEMIRAGVALHFDLRTLYLRDLSFHGCTVTSLNVFPNLVGYIERDEICPVLANTWPLERLVEAQTAFIAKAPKPLRSTPPFQPVHRRPCWR